MKCNAAGCTGEFTSDRSNSTALHGDGMGIGKLKRLVKYSPARPALSDAGGFLHLLASAILVQYKYIGSISAYTKSLIGDNMDGQQLPGGQPWKRLGWPSMRLLILTYRLVDRSSQSEPFVQYFCSLRASRGLKCWWGDGVFYRC